MRYKKWMAMFLAAGMVLAVGACGSRQGERDFGSAELTEGGDVSKEQGTLEDSGAAEKDDADVPAESSENSAGSGNPDISEGSAADGNDGSAAQSGEVTVTDMIGREVAVVPESYKRVVCIGAGALRMYSYIGDAALLAGVEDIDNETLTERPKMFDSVARPYLIAYGDVFAELDSCGVGGPNAQTAEAEKILACSPDIVISQYEDVEREDALQEQLGVPVVTLRTGPDGVFDEAFGQTVSLLGQVFGKEERAAGLLAFIAKERADIESRTAGIEEEDRPGVYICGLGNWGTTNHLMTAQNYISFDIANVRNAAADLGAPGIQPIEEEKFVSMGEDIDIMIIDAAAVKNIAPLFQEDIGMFDSCRAWREGQVYLQMAYNAYYTNYETALINAWYIGKAVYPDAFADIDMAKKTDQVTEMFLGQGLAEEIFAYPSSFGGYQKIDTLSFFQ